jgi:hypothetical protein
MTVKVDKNDPRYPSLTRGNNTRWQGTPDHVFLPESRKEISQAFHEVRGASNDGAFTTRSGGHCYIDSVDKSSGKYSVIDLGLVNQIHYDREHKAISIDAGCRLGEVYKYLFRRWGVTLPGGSCGTVGVGGHVSGGGYGLLSRLYGVTVDHLWGVEVITADGEVKLGCREDGLDTDGYKLWWAHTGGGGGNFGLVTRFLFRSNGSEGLKPEDCLPKAPARVKLLTLKLPWLTNNKWLSDLTSRYAKWCEAHAYTAESTGTDRLFGLYRVKTPHSVPENFALHLTVQVAQREIMDNGVDDALTQTVLDDFRRDIQVEDAKKEWQAHAPKGATGVVDLTEDLPWLEATQILSGGDWESRAKQKSAYHLKLTDAHQNAMLDDFENPGLHGRGDRRGGQGAIAQLDTYGGAVNRTGSMTTAYSHRDSSIKIQYQSYWHNADDDGVHLAWLKSVYSEIYHSDQNNGFPQAAHERIAPSTTRTDLPTTDGCFVNYLDDELEPDHDQHLYTKMYWGPKTFQRLQTFKQHLDAHGVFTSAQPIPPLKH